LARSGEGEAGETDHVVVVEQQDAGGHGLKGSGSAVLSCVIPAKVGIH
jgi:hypothetical protein